MNYPPLNMKSTTAAQYVGLPEAAFLRGVERGTFPSPIKFENKELWHRPSLDKCFSVMAGDEISNDWRKELYGE